MGEEEDSTLDSYLQQFSHIKKEGKPCPVEEARKFYVLALQESQRRTILCNCELAENMNQKIPYYIIFHQVLLLILNMFLNQTLL
jgi:hypothetical protein